MKQYNKKMNRIMISVVITTGLFFLSSMGSLEKDFNFSREEVDFSQVYPKQAILPYLGDRSCSTANATFTGETGWDQAGISAQGLGDINGDGFDDFLIGASNYSTGALNRGRVYLFYGYPGAYQGAYNVNQANATFTGVTAGDLAGVAIVAAGDVNNDGYNDFLIGANQYYGSGIGQTYLFYGSGIPYQGSYSTAQANATFVGVTVNDLAGTTLAGVGDVNNDGFNDFIIGADQYGAQDIGRAYLFYGRGSTDLLLGSYSVNQANATFTGEFAWDLASYRIAGASDVNGDGYDDFLIGAYNYSVGASGRGKAYLFYGSAVPYQGGYNVNQANATFLGEGAGDMAGMTLVGIHDLNKDGYSDILIGSLEYMTGNGRSYLFYGNGTVNQLSGNYNLASANITLVGEAVNDAAANVGGGGDINKDGYADFIIGADMYGANQIGRAYLFYGNGSRLLSGSYILTRANATFTGIASNDFTAQLVSIIGDVDSDGFDDFLITTRFYGTQDYGRCYLFKGGGEVPVFSSFGNLNFDIATMNNNITWTITDTTTQSPTYAVYKNESTWGTPNQPWISENPFNVSVDGLPFGDHNFTIVAGDGFGLNRSNTVIVTVFNTVPNVSGPGSILYEVGTTNNNITWTITDPSTPDPRFTVYKNGSTWGTSNQPWASGIPFNVSIDGLPVGDHNLTIIASDGYGGVNGTDEVIVRVISGVPQIDGPIPFSYELGTINNVIEWNITDLSTQDPRYSVYKNGTDWGSPDQSWITGVPVIVNIDGLTEGDHNFTIFVEDGYGENSSHQVIITVYIINTNGIWQPISLGLYSILCKTSPNIFAELLIQGGSTGAQIKITATSINPTSTQLPGAVRFFSILYDGTNQILFPVTVKFYYNESALPSNVQESNLAVYHYENGQWTIISRDVKATYDTIVAVCQSFSEYAIAEAPPQSSWPIDPVLVTWILSIVAIVAVSIGCIYKMKGKGGSNTGGIDTYPELEFED